MEKGKMEGRMGRKEWRRERWKEGWEGRNGEGKDGRKDGKEGKEKGKREGRMGRKEWRKRGRGYQYSVRSTSTRNINVFSKRNTTYTNDF
jgi:hypothetical protein